MKKQCKILPSSYSIQPCSIKVFSMCYVYYEWIQLDWMNEWIGFNFYTFRRCGLVYPHVWRWWCSWWQCWRQADWHAISHFFTLHNIKVLSHPRYWLRFSSISQIIEFVQTFSWFCSSHAFYMYVSSIKPFSPLFSTMEKGDSYTQRFIHTKRRVPPDYIMYADDYDSVRWYFLNNSFIQPRTKV